MRSRLALVAIGAMTLSLLPAAGVVAEEADDFIAVTGNTAADENELGWLFGRDTNTRTPVQFVAENPKIGRGSLLVPGPLPANQKFIAEKYLLEPADDLHSISFDFDSDGPANQFYINLYVNLEGSPIDGFYDCRYDAIGTADTSNGYRTVSLDLSDAETITDVVSRNDATCAATPHGNAGATVRAFALNVGDTGNNGNLRAHLDNVVIERADEAGLDSQVFSFEAPTVANVRLANEASAGLYTTIGDALADPERAPGDTIMVGSGIYVEDVALDESITLMGATEVAPTARAPEIRGVVTVGGDEVTIAELVLDGGNRRDRAIQNTTAGTNNVQILDNVIHSFRLAGVNHGFASAPSSAEEPGTNWVVSDNVIEMAAIPGQQPSIMTLFNLDDLTVTGNTLSYLGSAAAESPQKRGVNLDGVQRAQITSNVIDLNRTNPAFPDWALQVSMSDRAAQDITVASNTLRDAYSGIVALSQRDVTDLAISGNTIENVVVGVMLNGGGTAPTDSPLRYENVQIIGNDVTAGSLGVLIRDLHTQANEVLPGTTEVEFENILVCGNQLEAIDGAADGFRDVVLDTGVTTIAPFDISNGACPSPPVGGGGGGGGPIGTPDDDEADEVDDEITVLPLTECLTTFTDLAADGEHTETICVLAALEHIQGFDDDTFRPGANITRAQTASILASILALSTDEDADFSDVFAGQTHAEAIAALTELGIIQGFDDGTFGPGLTITRGQLASLLARALDLDVSGTPDFDDVPADDTHAGAIAALAELGVIQGFGDGTFRPDDPVTRGQFATFVVNAFGLRDEVDLDDEDDDLPESGGIG